MIYNPVVLPHLNYCNVAWGNLNNCRMLRLYKLQKKAIRIISKAPYLAQTEPLFRRYKTFDVFELNKYNLATFMFLCYKGTIPASLSIKFCTNSDIHSYYTRQSSNFHIPLVRTNVSQNSIFFKGPIIWNNLQSKIKESPTLNTFKRRYKNLHFYQSI